MKIIREPKVYLVGRQSVEKSGMGKFLSDNALTWQTDTGVGSEMLCESAGRLCYMSFGKGRKSNREYIDHLLEVGHGSVLEHAVWNFIVTGVSRSFTHELVRHRAGFGYSQLSQRYVDEAEADFIEPDIIAGDPELDKIWRDAIEASRESYKKLVEGLTKKYTEIEDATSRRKLARQAARSVLPNSTETKIFITANARALRNFIELRASPEADVEIRKVAVEMLKILMKDSPSIFGDYALTQMNDGTFTAKTKHRKV